MYVMQEDAAKKMEAEQWFACHANAVDTKVAGYFLDLSQRQSVESLARRAIKLSKLRIDAMNFDQIRLQVEAKQFALEAGFPFNKYGLLQGDEDGEIDADEMFERFAKAVIDETIKRLAAGVSVEPVAMQFQTRTGAWCDFLNDKHRDDTIADGTWPIRSLYTADAIAAARVQENERCLALMDAIGCDWRDAGDMAKFYATNYLCDAIRALLGKEAT